MAVVTFHGHRHRKPELPPVVFDPGEELREALLGVGDGKLLEERPIGAGNSHLMSLASYIHHPHRHGSWGPPLGTSFWGLIQRVSSTMQGHTPKGGTIPVDTAGMRKEARAAFQVERTKPQTPRATPPPPIHTTTKSNGRPRDP